MEIHVVQPGDTLFRLSRQYNLPMERLIRDPALRRAMGTRALERYQREFTGEVFARNTEQIYLDILKGAKHGT